MNRRSPAAMQGFQPERKVPVDPRHWDALKRLVWRMKVNWGFVENEARDLLATCRHDSGCRGLNDLSAPCLPSCPDRQLRSSALVFLNNACEFSAVQANRTGGVYTAPTREHFDLLVGTLVALDQELAELHGKAVRVTAELPPAADGAAPAELPAALDDDEATPTEQLMRQLGEKDSEDPLTAEEETQG